MYKVYYNFLKQKCEDVKSLYIDTDCFIIEAIGENFDDIMLILFEVLGSITSASKIEHISGIQKYP